MVLLWLAEKMQLDNGVSYTQVSAGGKHTVPLQNDGTAVACGDNALGQCDIPPLDGNNLGVMIDLPKSGHKYCNISQQISMYP